MDHKRGLGKGLTDLGIQALLGAEASAIAPNDKTLINLAIDAISPKQGQPRQTFPAEALAELAASIRAQGVIQPVVVRPLGDDHYELIAGERRWRAAQMAGLSDIPALIKPVSDQTAAMLALIENLQREDLNPIETAHGLQTLIETHGLTQQALADALGKSRPTLTNALRLLKLDPAVQSHVLAGRLEAGHGKALLALPSAQQLELAEQAIGQQWSVRQTEAMVKRVLDPQLPKVTKGLDTQLATWQAQLAKQWGTEVLIKPGKQDSGKLIITYKNPDMLAAWMRQWDAKEKDN